MYNSRKKHLILSILYHFRCLNFNQIYGYVYKCEGLAEKTCLNTLSLLVKDGLIEKIGFYSEYSYYVICAKGISFLRKNGIFSINKHNWEIIKFKELLSAKEIRLNDNNISHQLALNQFVINFMENFADKETEYYDEKYVSSIIDGIRPDGIIKHNNTLFFLEMDMNTERKTRLMKKWESYRNFIHSRSFYENMTYDIKVLFILDNVSEKSSRKNNLKGYIDINLRNEISNSFNIYIGTPKELTISLDNMFNNADLLPTILYTKGFSITKGCFTDSELKDFSFDNYIYKVDNDGTLLVENGITTDFVLDDFRNENMYSYKKFIMYSKFNALFNKIKGYNLKYIIVVNSVDDAVKLIKSADCYFDNIYFTTVERLNEYTFNSAIFTIGRNNILYHFSDGNLKIKQEEQYINTAI